MKEIFLKVLRENGIHYMWTLPNFCETTLLYSNSTTTISNFNGDFSFIKSWPKSLLTNSQHKQLRVLFKISARNLNWQKLTVLLLLHLLYTFCVLPYLFVIFLRSRKKFKFLLQSFISISLHFKFSNNILRIKA